MEPSPRADARDTTVDGTVTAADSAGVGGLRIEIVDRNSGADVKLAEAVSDEHGRYAVELAAEVLKARDKPRPDLQARAYDGDSFVAASEVRFDADARESLDIPLPAGVVASPSEYETLTASLAAHYGGRLAELEESDHRGDVSYLATKSGWDARAVAMAALADQFSRRGEEMGQRVQPAWYYALFRAGHPADPETLYRVDPPTLAAVWRHALEQGVIPSALEDDLDRSAGAFSSLGAGRLLDASAFSGASTVKDLARRALGDDPARLEGFAGLITRYRGEPDRLWAEVSSSLGGEAAARLKVDGQLAYLTLDNAALIGRLHDAEGDLSSTLELAQRGYDRAAKWNSMLDDAVPDHLPGATPAERRTGYADMLAAQVRLSFPTAVIAARVGGGDLPLGVPDTVRDGVADFLSGHQGRFDVGMQPIEQYLDRNGLREDVDAPVTEQIKRLQRVYQITPTDDAMTTLLAHDLDSAYRVARYDEDEFVQSLGGELGGEDQARLTHAKSLQVHNAVLNVASSYLTLRGGQSLGFDARRPITGLVPSNVPGASDVVAYATLEGLFGALDYCDCRHCRSVSSPAAYLVDLLLLIDRPVHEKENPQSVLLERRPDIQHLPLTCENTNTPLPYIDVVNETLGHFVAANLSLAGYTGHDTGDRLTAEELLARPQHRNEAAYMALGAATFPPPLPFHEPLETLRRQFRQLEIPLATAMETLRASDAIEGASPASYGWEDILMEELELSRDEHRLLTDRTVTLQALCGYPAPTPEDEVLSALRRVKAFTRRTRLTVLELTEILRTVFVNPHAELLPRLERLQVSLTTLKALKDGSISDAAFDALLPANLDQAEYGGDVKSRSPYLRPARRRPPASRRPRPSRPDHPT